jgi:hypothetical protein
VVDSRKTVTLVDPSGNEFNASHPADITNLVYGAGYKVKGNMTPDEAAQFLLERGPVAEFLQPLAPTEGLDVAQKVSKGGKGE